MESNNSFSDASFALVRTDVRLTGNIKFTVDSNGDIWLNSIDSNEELSNEKYKHCAITDEWTYPANVHKLIGGNESVIDVLYDVKNEVDPDSPVDDLDYSKQYDFSLYFSGARYLKDVNYTERFSYFAPFYFKNKDIPEYFVILRIDGPLNAKLSELIENPNLYDTEKYMYDIINNSTIIKTFSLKTDTRLGRYIRKIVSADAFPQSPLSVNFNEGMETVYSGVHVENGVYSSASELMYDNFYSKDIPIKIFEEYITNGFKRHGLLYPNIINFEFLFNDESAEIFEHNRYIGFYVNEIEFSKLMLSYTGQKDYQDYFGNEPHLYNKIDRLPSEDLFITNTNGCKLSIGKTTTVTEGKSYDKIKFSEDNQVISVLQDKKGDFYRIIDAEIEDENITSITLKNKEVNIKNFLGSDDVVSVSDITVMPENPGKSFVRINFNDYPKNGERLIIYHIGGTHVNESGEKYDIINFSDGIGTDKLYGDAGEYYYDIITEDNNELSYKPDLYFRGYAQTQDDIIQNVYEEGDYVEITTDFDFNGGLYVYNEENDLEYKEIYFLSKGDNVVLVDGKKILNYDITNYSNYYTAGIVGSSSEIRKFVQGVAECINEIPQKQFNAYYSGNGLVIVYNTSGNYNDKLSIVVDIDDTDSFTTIGNEVDGRIKAIGGSDYGNVMLLDYRLADNIDNTCVVRIKDGYSMVDRVERYAGYYERNLSSEQKLDAYNAIDNYIAVILEEGVDAKLNNRYCSITHEFEIPLGYLSIYNVKDFDFDFYSTRYSIVNDFDKNKYEITSKQLLSKKYIYRCLGTNIKFNKEDSVVFIKKEENGNIVNTRFFYVIDDDVMLANDDIKVYQYLYINGFDEGINLNMEDVCDSVINTEADIVVKGISFKKLDTYCYDIIESPYLNDYTFYYYNTDTETVALSGNVDCEYNYNKENYYPTYNSFSKTVPYSCKWGYTDGEDLRGNPYRLNVSNAFGINNMSPDIYKYDIDNDSMNLEWLYLMTNAIDGVDNYCYLNKWFDVYNADFDTDLTYITNGVPSYRYSVIRYNKQEGVCETFFRGVKIQFRELSDTRLKFYTESNVKYVENSDKYDGYRFSAVLLPVEEKDDDDFPPVEMEVFENADKKYIIYIVKLHIGSVSRIRYGEDNKRSFVEFSPKHVYQGDITENFNSDDLVWSDSSDDDNTYEYYFVNCSSYVFMDGKTPIQNGSTISKKIGSDESIIINYDNNEWVENNLYSEETNYNINGDYRIIFDNNGLCNLTYTDLYKLKDKKFNTGNFDYSTIKIPTNFKIFTNRLSSVDIFNRFDLNLCEEVSNLEKYNTLTYTDTNDNRLFLHTYSKYDGKITPVDYQSIKKANVSKLMLNDFYNGSFTLDRNLLSPIEVTNVSQMFGGKNYYMNLFNNFSVGMIVKMFNDNNYIIKYDSDTKVAISFLKSTVIKKSTNVTTEKILSNSNKVIGYNYSCDKKVSDNFLYRYSGKYTPIFNTILAMENVENVGYNTMFNSDLDSFGILKNFCHMKVSDGNIYEYGSQNSNYNLQYELINETPIGHKDFNLLHTSWDLNFHMKYIAPNSYEDVPGTMRIEEDDTFINNVIILPDEVNLTKFDVEQVNDVSVVDIDKYQIVYSYDDRKVSVRINLTNVMYEKLIKLGLNDSFSYLDVDSDYYYTYYGMPIDDYIKLYVKKNILPLYDINKVYLYFEKVQSSNNVTISNEDFEDKKIGNFIIDRNVKINKDDNYIISFEYSLKPNYNSLINLVAIMKLI